MKKYLWLLGCSLLTLMVACMASAQTQLDKTKVVLLSDTHVMAPELLVEEGTAWYNYLDSDRKLIEYSRELFDVVIANIKDNIRPGLVLITGDLTKDGEVLSHEYVVKKLDELKAIGIQTLVIPGNHDRGAHYNANYYIGDHTTPAEVATNEQFAKFYADYGYGETSERDSASLSYICEPIAGMAIIGIDSGTDGTVRESTLSWVCRQAEQARSKGKRVIAMMHHPLVPHFNNSDKFLETSSVNDCENVRNRLADAGIGVVLTGHFHTSDILKEFNADLTKEIYDVSTGALSSFPCDYRILTLSEDKSQLSIETERITELPSNAAFHEQAEEQLKEKAKKMISGQGGAYAMVADDAANAYIEHAKGNENESAKAQEILKSLLNYAKLARLLHVMDESRIEMLENMAHSMLEDLSNYGVEGRENRVDDLTLTITLPVSETNAVNTMKGKAQHDPTVYSLNGIKASNSPQRKGLYIHHRAIHAKGK